MAKFKNAFVKKESSKGQVVEKGGNCGNSTELKKCESVDTMEQKWRANSFQLAVNIVGMSDEGTTSVNTKFYCRVRIIE